jgi:hypothetical protein
VSLTATQTRAAELLAHGFTQGETARRVGCSVRSLGRWLADNPDFALAAQAETDSVGDQPVEVLRSLLSSDNDQVRLRAAAALTEIDKRNAAPDQHGATIHVAAYSFDPAGTPPTVNPVETTQHDLPPGSQPWLVLHLESAPLPPTPYVPHVVDPVRYAQAEE